MELARLFDDSVGFEPAGDFEAFLQGAPARWVVYLLADANDRPVQLLCVKNLRASLKRRLGEQEEPGLSKRVNYRELVRRVYWRRVDSAFEADWVYLEAARRIFPESYRGMVGFRQAWFVHVDPQAAFPRYTRTNDLAQKTGVLLGPVEDKHSAQRLIQAAEDLHDLCRYYNVLIEAPGGTACAYKEMGKCPAPCDGSIPMEAYREAVRRSVETIVDPRGFIDEQAQHMQAVAAALQFEQAGRIKAKIDTAGQFGKGPFRQVRRIEQFEFVSLQRGPREGLAKMLLIVRGHVEVFAGLIDEPKEVDDLLGAVLARAEALRHEPVTDERAERIALVSQHLLSPRATQGVFLPLEAIGQKPLAKAFGELRKQKVAETAEGDEGVMKELQAMDGCGE